MSEAGRILSHGSCHMLLAVSRKICLKWRLVDAVSGRGLDIMYSVGYNVVPKGRPVISRERGSRVLLILNRVLEFRACGWLDNESVASGGDGVHVGSGHFLIFFAVCGLSLLREGLGGRGLYLLSA